MNLLIKKLFGSILISFFLFSTFLIYSNQLLALNNSKGEKLFLEHCSGCHVNGGNIIRRNKTLKISALKRNGLDNPEAIAKVARNGIGNMSGYKKVLGEEGDKIVANWIWEQSQKAWVQG
ncbi:c-type cytochrome [Prochlorococcus sp. MIT 1223]|uniref:c-type cytochrome n=1 Tax=Prochlorococcus sp. MIT 1223 TaxID=3096217 RepID=UPI002A7493BC|nr:c-type cytochrome [Prochlorococcus sp. MIT 1223]